MRIEDQFYEITLDDYGSPAYCSFDKQYAGTMDMLVDFFRALETIEEPGAYVSGLMDAFQRYRQGYHDASAYVALGERRLIRPMTVCDILSKDVTPFFYEHTNVWGFPYYISSEKMHADLVYLRKGEQFMRYVKAAIASPRYGTEEDHCREPIDGFFWGHPKVLALDEGILFNRIMFCDHIYETEDEMRRDMIEPTDIDFTGFFSDVFGDG